MKLRTDIPGGNFCLEKIEGHTVLGRQEMRDTAEWWFHWRFLMEDLEPGESWRVEFTDGEVVGYWGPAVKWADEEWHCLGEKSRMSGSCFVFRVPEECRRAEFAFSLPYDMADWQRFIRRYDTLPFVQNGVLCSSRKGRDVPYLRIGQDAPHGRLILTARHHACETTGNYFMEGILSELLQREDPLIYPILQRYEVLAIPFMDLDGVVDGDQGKARAPHDHNQDYREGRYPSVRSVKKWIDEAPKDLILIDCHSPWKWGAQNDHVFMVRPKTKQTAIEDSKVGREIRLECMREHPTHCLIYEQLVDKKVQTDWNGHYLTDAETEKLRGAMAVNSSGYAAQHGAKIAFSMETTYFGTPHNRTSQESMRNLGRKVALGLEHYLCMSED